MSPTKSDLQGAQSTQSSCSSGPPSVVDEPLDQGATSAQSPLQTQSLGTPTNVPNRVNGPNSDEDPQVGSSLSPHPPETQPSGSAIPSPRSPILLTPVASTQETIRQFLQETAAQFPLTTSPPQPPHRETSSCAAPNSQESTIDNPLGPSPPAPKSKFCRPGAADFFHKEGRRTHGDALLARIHEQLLPLLEDQDSQSQDPTTSVLEPSPPPSTPEPCPQSIPAVERPPVPHGDTPITSSQGEAPPALENFREHWGSVFAFHLNWEDFCLKANEFATSGRELAASLMQVQSNRPRPVPRDPNRPSARRIPNGRQLNRFDPNDASLYRHSKKRAARQILTDDSPPFAGSVDEAAAYFTESYSHKPCDTNHLQNLLDTHVPTSDTATPSALPPTAKEVSIKLRSCANTSPGPDRIEYRHLKTLDPQGTILSSMFAHCIKHQDVPPLWKEARTILICKKGSTADVSNFRPIALMSCVYKLLMGVIAKRLTTWAIDANILSSEQKSARPTERCYEHTYILQSLIGDARRNQKNVFLAWLDLSNAFGSLPHAVLRTTLSTLAYKTL